MHASALIQFSRRWLPLLVLLVALAQLATASHQHEGESHRLADCGLCLQHAGLKHLHSGYSLPQIPAVSGFLPALSPAATDIALPMLVTRAIRAPPVPALLFVI